LVLRERPGETVVAGSCFKIMGHEGRSLEILGVHVKEHSRKPEHKEFPRVLLR